MMGNSLKVTKIAMVFFAFFTAFSAWAQQSGTKASGTSQIKRSQLKKAEPQQSVTRLDVDLSAIGYAEEAANDSSFQQQAQLGLKFKKEGSFFAGADITLGTFSTPKSMYYAFPDAYVGYGSSNANITFGRKKENLNFADSFFNFGLVQSHQTNDNINFIEGGLIGLTARFSTTHFGVMAGFNPIFIPNQGPQTQVEDGKITSSNRWAPSPPSKFKFGDDHKNINYAIRDYQLLDIINSSGYMASAYLGPNSDRPYLRVTYTYKPLNDIVLSRDTYSDISTFEGYVYLTPNTIMHQVTAADINFDFENVKTTLSVISDQPENKTAKDLEFIQNLNPLNIVAGYISVDLSSWAKKKLEIYAGAASISGGEVRDMNSQNQESSFAIADSRTLFKKPLRLGVKSEMFFIYNKAVDADVSYTYDQDLKGALLSATVKYGATKNLTLRVGADVIGVENELPKDAQGNFLDQNKANDRFFAGVNYAF